jgi:hypothetical protein
MSVCRESLDGATVGETSLYLHVKVVSKKVASRRIPLWEIWLALVPGCQPPLPVINQFVMKDDLIVDTRRWRRRLSLCVIWKAENANFFETFSDQID